MNIWLIVFYVMGVPIVFYILYRCHLWLSKIFHAWMAKMDRIQQREETLEQKEKDFMERCNVNNTIVWQEKDKAMQQYQAAIEAMKASEAMRIAVQSDIEKFQEKIKDLEKQLHHARQRGVRLSEKSKKTKGA